MRKYFLPGVLLVALIAAAAWGYQQQQQKNDYHTYLDIQFQRQFYDLIGHVENVQVDLSKAMLSGSSNDMAKYLNDTVMQSYLAQEKLTQLPFNHGSIRQTEKFLSQIGDYCTAMVNKALEGYVPNEEEMTTMQELHSYANLLAQELFEMQQQVVSGGVNFGDLRSIGNRNLQQVDDHMKNLNLINIEERMQDYPELIYDGPFSEHMKDVKPRLEGDEISQEEALRIVSETFKNQGITNPRIIENIQNTRLDGYYIRAEKEVNNGREVSVAVSKTGGQIIWYLDPRQMGESTLDTKEAISKATEFLEDKGYKDMVPTYTMAYEGEIIINYAYQQEEVLIYPDLIKVKVALDNGDIIGMETEGYLINHHQREIEEPELTEEEAREKISSRASVERARLAIIPTEGNHEVLCYEFKVKFGQDNFLVYIDANTGHQRRILLMVEQEDGTLVI
ncbi:germination protein YpeB [Alkaliphilus peptidifermentans]|uniref:Germination protein YpeB n=1 Tax=Alkaliphilus peptidifermentans DSM 18978 TaxID=1120976 RepID=A0A1G5HZS9_9FIRM|nr:germination protein YpeB [Alkaliphilus peptidifermentans]SCY69204.1 germination protein YpeB [Alkaliphilus peptidifermentans DSM 18978]